MKKDMNPQLRTRRELKTWETILNNLYDAEEEVEILYLDNTDEWVLCSGCELFEDGFSSEREACNRLNWVYLNLREALPQ